MVLLRKQQFTVMVWLMSVLGLPLVVFLGSLLANAVTPDASCLPYDGSSGVYMALLAGVPFATIVTVMSACNCLREGKGFNLWMAGVSVLYMALAVFILFQTNACA